MKQQGELSRLVNEAKGDDRTIKQYASDSGVDASLISRIISGDRHPRVFPDSTIFRDLTSEKAKPRNAVTRNELENAAMDDYRKIIRKGGIVFVANSNGSNGTIISNKSDENNQIEENKFSKMISGLISLTFAQLGIDSRLVIEESEKYLYDKYDLHYEIKGQLINEYSIKLMYIDELVSIAEVNEKIERVIAKIALLESKANRKISIITNNDKAYNVIENFAGNNSINANISVIFVDMDTISMSKEIYISHFIGEEKNEMYIV